MDGYQTQPMSLTALTEIAAAYQANGQPWIPVSRFPGLIVGIPTKQWGRSGLNTADVQAALPSITGGDAITLQWDGFTNFIIVPAAGPNANLTVHPKPNK